MLNILSKMGGLVLIKGIMGRREAHDNARAKHSLVTASMA